MVLGYTLSELRTLCSVIDFTKVQNLDADTILQFPEILGIDDARNIEKLLKVLIRAKGFKDTITFEAFYQVRPDAPSLRVFATNLDTLGIEEFGSKTPRVPLWFAVRASSSIPFLFTPALHPETGNSLSDGALISHFPFHHLSDSERRETLGISFNILQTSKPASEKFNIATFFLNCFLSAYNHQDRDLYSKWGSSIIDIKCSEHIAVKFNATQEERIEIMNLGRAAAEEFFSHPKRHGGRRNSAP
jgi:predicted acylesterase/phospholipase RssA